MDGNKEMITIGATGENAECLACKKWMKLLVLHPEYAPQCDWSKFTSLDWEILLSCKPEFADKCNMHGLSPESILFVLARQPKLLPHFEISVFTANERAYLQKLAKDEEGFPDLKRYHQKINDNGSKLMESFAEWGARHDIVRRTFLGFADCMHDYQKEENEEYEQERAWELHPVVRSIKLICGDGRYGDYASCVLDIVRVNHEEDKITNTGTIGEYNGLFRMNGECFDDSFVIYD